MKMSPFTYANQIKRPILLIHGEADNNTGTYPINSERLYQAVRGNGGTGLVDAAPRIARLHGQGEHRTRALGNVDLVSYKVRKK